MKNGRRADFLDHDNLMYPRKKENTMAKLHKHTINATDIASQFWCEKQMELSYLYGRKATAEMHNGSITHKKIESIINISIKLKPKSYSDSFYKNLYASYLSIISLPERGVARELNIYGSFNGFKITGKIDEIRFNSTELVIYEDKIKSKDREPSEAQLTSHKVQVLLYLKLLNDIKEQKYTASNFNNSYRTSNMVLTPEFQEQLEALGISKEMRSIHTIAEQYFSSIKNIKRISNVAHIKYTHSPTGRIIKTYDIEYNESSFIKQLNYAMKYWNGEREARPVEESEKWKCNYCPFFGKKCTVWYTKEQEVL